MRPPLILSASLFLLAACGGTGAGAAGATSPDRVGSCAGGTDSDGNDCVVRQGAAHAVAASPAAATTPPALAALLAPADDPPSSSADAADPSAGLAHLSADKMYRAAWALERKNDFDGARAIYGDILTYFPDSPRAAYARFAMGEMYLKEGLAFGSYLSDAADAFATVAEDPGADPALVPFALMRLEQTSELTGDASRAAQSKERLARQFPRSDAARALSAKTR